MPTLRELESWTGETGAARELRITKQAVHKRLQAGTFPGPVVRTGAGWLISPDAIETLRKERGRG